MQLTILFVQSGFTCKKVQGLKPHNMADMRAKKRRVCSRLCVVVLKAALSARPKRRKQTATTLAYHVVPDAEENQWLRKRSRCGPKMKRRNAAVEPPYALPDVPVVVFIKSGGTLISAGSAWCDDPDV